MAVHELPADDVGDQVEPTIRGVIHDTNLHGRFDLLLYDDGILAVKGNYVRTALLAGGATLGGAGATAAVGGVAGIARLGRNRRDKRADSPTPARAALLSAHPTNHFIDRAELTDLALTKRWYAHSVTFTTGDGRGGGKYSWKPALNNYRQVRQTLLDVYGTELVNCNP